MKRLKLEKLIYACSKLKRGKAVGMDNMPNELIKLPVVQDALLALFNCCLRNSQIPTWWQKALIHPIPKVANVETDPLKYRGISLQSCVYKLYSSIVTNRLNKYLDEQGGLSEEQNGFRKGRNCIEHIFHIGDCNQKQLEEKKRCVCLVLLTSRKLLIL